MDDLDDRTIKRCTLTGNWLPALTIMRADRKRRMPYGDASRAAAALR
jgi:hypothetical protein